MSVFPKRKIFAIPAAVALMALAVPLASVRAQSGDEWFSYSTSATPRSPVFTTSFVALAGGDYAWLVDVSPPAPALLSEYYYDENPDDDVFGVMVPIPSTDPSWSTYLTAAKLLTVTFGWGDNTAGTLHSNTPMSEQSVQGQVRCNNSVDLVAGKLVPTAFFGTGCTAEGWHTYAAGTQGVMMINVTAAQDGQTSTPTTYEQFVLDPLAGGSLIGKGTLVGRDGGMYDQQFKDSTNKTVTFNINAKRPSGTTATQASILVTAPGMVPDGPGGLPSNDATGMTFKGSAPMMQMVVTRTGTTTEVTLERVEGKVTNSLGDAGGAWASIHVKAERGKPTLMRISIQNTQAGYTYLDTGWVEEPWMGLADGLDRPDLLLSGSVRVGAA